VYVLTENCSILSPTPPTDHGKEHQPSQRRTKNHHRVTKETDLWVCGTQLHRHYLNFNWVLAFGMT